MDRLERPSIDSAALDPWRLKGRVDNQVVAHQNPEEEHDTTRGVKREAPADDELPPPEKSMPTLMYTMMGPASKYEPISPASPMAESTESAIETRSSKRRRHW